MTKTEATEKVRKQDVEHQIAAAKIARNKCRCKVRRDTTKALKIAEQMTPGRKKSILRELMLICLVKARGKDKKVPKKRSSV